MTSVESAAAGRIVVGFDGSDHAQRAVEWAAVEALSRGVGLFIVSAFTPPASGSTFGFGAYLSPDALDDMSQRMSTDLAAYADTVRAAHPGLDVAADVVMGSPTTALIEASEDSVLTVVGSRGLGGFRGLLLGSVGVNVAANAHGPVVVLRKDAPADASTIVVGVDGSDLSDQAVDFAFDMASRHGWSLRAIHAWEVPSYDVLAAPMGPPPMSIDDFGEVEARVPAEALAGHRERYPDVTVEVEVVRGTPARAILDNAKDAAMIAVGSRGRGEFMGAMLGSVGQGVLFKAKVPVAVIGGGDEEED